MSYIRLILVSIFILTTATIFAQNVPDDDALLTITISSERCDMVLVEEADDAEVTPDAEITPEPEVTPDPDADPALDYPVITLGDECEEVIPLLRVPNNGTLWLALAVPDEDEWQQFELLEDDDYPPQFDRRGRFIGCAIPIEGEQTCNVLWTYDDVTYLVEIPVIVGDAFVAPTNVPAATDVPVDTNAGNAPPPANDEESTPISPTQQPSGGAESTEEPIPTMPGGGGT